LASTVAGSSYVHTCLVLYSLRCVCQLICITHPGLQAQAKVIGRQLLGCLMARLTCGHILTRLSGLTQAWREEAAAAYCGGCSRSWQPYWREVGSGAAAEDAAGLCQRSQETMVRLLSALPAAKASKGQHKYVAASSRCILVVGAW